MKKILLLFLLLVQIVFGDIVPGTASAVGGPLSSCTTCTFGNFTTTTFNSSRVIANIGYRDGGSNTPACSLDGVAGTLVNHLFDPFNGTAQFEWTQTQLTGIGVGAQSFVCVGSGSYDTISAHVVQFDNAYQTTPITIKDTTVQSSGTSVANDVTTTVDNTYVIQSVTTNQTGTDHTGHTELLDNNITGGRHRSAYQIDVASGAITTTTSWSGTAAGVGTALAIAPNVVPVVGGGGTITTANITSTTIDLSVTAATDDVSAQSALQYEFRQSTTNNMGSVANAEANGTIIRAYTANDVTHTATGLSSGTTYWFQVIVKDEAGNKSIYTQNDETTVAGDIPGGGTVSSGAWPPHYKILPQTLPGGAEDEVYDGATLQAVSGKTPITWAVASGALPAGITLSAAGVLAGTPTEGGTFNFVAKATTNIGGNAYEAFSIELEVSPDPPPPDIPELWELTTHLDAAAVRTHYISQSSAGSGNASSCANAESFATANGHYVAGDHHLACGATYTGFQTMSRNCTEAQPCVFRSVVGADGTPVDAYFSNAIRITGSWVSVRGMRFGATTDVGQPGIDLRGTGDSAIANFIINHKGPGGIFTFPYSGRYLHYGNVLVNNGICGEGPAGGGQEHNDYGHSKGHVFGIRYVINLISLDGLCSGGASPRWNFHNYNSGTGTDTRSNGWHIQDSTFQNGSFLIGTQGVGEPDANNTIKNNYFFSLTQGTQFRVGYTNVFQGTVTGNLWYNTALQWRMWGTGGTTYTKPGPTIFTGNEIISPQSSKFFSEFWTRTYTGATSLGTQGAPKIDDNVVLDLNTYRISSGGTFAFHANGTNSGDVSFAGWKTASDNARVTPSAGDTNGFDVNSTYTNTLRTADQNGGCYPYYYQPNWGYCRIVNWDANTSVVILAAEMQKIVGDGKDYNIWNIRTGPFPSVAAALETGTCASPCGDVTVNPLPSATDGLIIVFVTSEP